MNEQRNAKEIELAVKPMIQLLEDPSSNFIFGCGWMGEKLLSAIKALGYTVDGFVVTEKKTEIKDGIPVYSIEKLSQSNNKKNNIFVALRDQDVELIERLKGIFFNVYPVSYPRDITLIEAKYYLDYFQTRDVDCSNAYLQLGDYHFVNPFYKPDDYLLSFVYEAGDLVLPVIYKDEGRIDEGTYEYGHTMLQNGDVVLDCGSNIGLFANIAIQKGCQVYAFEPMPDAIQYLRELNQTLDIKINICPYALADRCGTAQFHIQNFDLLGASMLKGHNSIDKNCNVDVITVDQFVENEKLDRVDYIKADIEGSERDMLRGAAKTIQRFHPKISICTYHLPDDKEVLESILKAIEPKYVIEHRWKKMYAYVPEKE